MVNPSVGGIGQNFAAKIFVNVVGHWDVFKIAAIRVGDRLAALENRVAEFVEFWAFDGDFVVAEIFGVENFAVAVDAAFVAINSVVAKFCISLNDNSAAMFGNVIALLTDTFAARFKAVARVD